MLGMGLKKTSVNNVKKTHTLLCEKGASKALREKITVAVHCNYYHPITVLNDNIVIVIVFVLIVYS